MLFISYFCLILVARTSNTMLNRSNEIRHPCFVPALSGKAFVFYLLGMMLVVGFLNMASIMLRNDLSTPTLLSVFYHKWVLCLIKCFFSIYWYDHVIFVFPFFYVMYYINWFVNMVTSLHPWVESYLIMVYDVFHVLPNAVWQYFIEELVSVFISNVGLYFFFFVVSLSGFGVWMMLVS